MDQNPFHAEFLASFDEYGDAIFRFCLMKTQNRELAEDLTQETFMRYWQSLRDGKDISKPRPYLYTIAGNLVIDWYRRKKATSLDSLQDAGYELKDEKSETALFDSELGEILAAIDELEEKDREALLLRYVEGLDPKDIAEITGETANTVSVRITRALQRTRNKLGV